MNESDLIDLFFGGMGKLGPGSTEDTLAVLAALPAQSFDLIVDAGCGSGRHTLDLARQLRKPIHALDLYQPFLDRLQQRAQQAGLGDLVTTHCLDMAAISTHFEQIDLLWSESAVYNIGFEQALRSWFPAIRPGGFVVVSELSQIAPELPEDARRFWEKEYPGLQTFEANRAVAKAVGFQHLHTHRIPDASWVEGYYDILRPRAEAHLPHPEPAVREIAAGLLEEIRIHAANEEGFAYFFYVLKKP
ncbi:MAG: class I SAM-dependent methyltransferase [Opitutales bacterium]|nr:class I SAM-dependent methyltransferase [Opitutales bacterium]